MNGGSIRLFIKGSAPYSLSDPCESEGDGLVLLYYKFLSDFSTDKDYKLTICHRCGKNILAWGQHVIAGDDTREIPKTLKSVNSAPDGMAKLLRFRSNESEVRGVVKLIKWLHDNQSVPYSEILILFRTDYRGAFSKPIKKLLSKENIPVSASNIDELLNRSEIVKALSLLRLVADENDSLAWWTLLHQTRNIGCGFIDSIYQQARSRSGTFGSVFRDLVTHNSEALPNRGKNEVKQLVEQVNTLLRQIQLEEDNQEHWGQWIVNLVNDSQLPEVGDEFKELLLKIDELAEQDSSLSKFLSQIYPLGKDIINSESDGVRFMTMMSSKGLTTKAVIVVGVDNDLVPRVNADLSEERRLLYVAMTRPTDYLFLTWCGQRRGPTARAGRLNVLNRRQPSRFLERGPVESEDGDQFVGSFTGN